MNFLDGGTDDVEYEQVNRKTLDGTVTKMQLIISKVNLGDIDADDTSCHGYYIIQFYLYLYTLHEDLNIDGQSIYSGEMVYKGTYFTPLMINYCYYVSSTD